MQRETVETTRRAMLAAVAASPVACRAPRRAAPASPAADPWGGLEVVKTGTLREDEPGGIAVVLLHGWGAPGGDLVPLAHALQHPRTRFFVPAAPLPERGGGRAWWHLDTDDRPAFEGLGERIGAQPHPRLAAVRAAMQAVLHTIRERHRPEALVLGGFSQGAMVSLDLALAGAPVDRVAALSGVLLADSVAELRTPGRPRPAVFVSHGRQDPVLPFAGGQLVKDTLERHGFPVTWRPFEGGHEIPPTIVEGLRSFLFGG